MARICIVGGGILGLACAYRLSEVPGHDITLIEQGHLGQGSTSLAVGMVLRVQETEAGQALSRRSYELWDVLSAKGHVNLRQVGHVSPIYSAAGIAHAEGLAALQRRMGREPFRVIDVDELARVVPDYQPSPGAIAAIWDEAAMYVDGAEAASGLAVECRDRGVTIMTQAKLTGASRPSGTHRHLLHTTKGDVPADVVVNVAGGWVAQVGALLEAPVEVINERHEAYVFRILNREVVLPMLLDFVPGVTSEEGLYFRGEGPQRVVAGLHSSDLLGTASVDPDNYSRRYTESGMEKVFGLLTDALPDLDLGFESAWDGLYPHHPSNRFVLGPHPDDPTVFVGSGLGGRGLGPGPALGEALAEWIAFGEPQTLPQSTYFGIPAASPHPAS
jgi:sarcosine oxidase subunit beta